MTRKEFEALMDDDKWSSAQRHMWRNLTPTSDEDTFRREMSRPDGIIECKRDRDKSLTRLMWKRMFPLDSYFGPSAKCQR